uniref:Uncharacterized protein n=1 Tax=Arundo donax TaxID=35708 RepID=A0A0A8YA47_ARUDO
MGTMQLLLRDWKRLPFFFSYSRLKLEEV